MPALGRLSSAYDKRRLPFGTSLARQISKQHLSNLNNVYWVGERSHKLLRESFANIPMPVPGPGVHGFFVSDEVWKKGVDEFRVWRRQHILISCSSLLEVYIKSAAVAAFSANPVLVDRSLEEADAYSYLKFPDRRPNRLSDLIKERSDSFTVGIWKERFYKMQLTLGSLPSELRTLETKLQSIQTTRNKIAHSYGMNGELRKTPWEPLNHIDVTPGKIEEATKTVSEAIRIMDEKIFGNHIGGYELFHEFSVWQKNRSLVDQNLESDFRDHIGKAFGRTPGREYNESMISYYKFLV